MSVKIRVSYSEDWELAGVIRLLSPVIKDYKIQPPKGRYNRAYIDLKQDTFTDNLVNEK